MRDKASIWTDVNSTGYTDVDEHHQAQTGASGLPGAKLAGYPDFGHNMLQYWCFDEGCK